jgi:N-methylhydantoinase A
VSLLIGIDVGGTFTDVVALDARSGAVSVTKVPSTPHNQALGFMKGLAKLKVPLADVERLMHGTTVATNAVLEGKGARVGMLVTTGFRDVLEIGRGERTKLYEFKLLKHPPLVPRSRRFEVRERTRADGTVVQPVSAEAIRAALARRVGEPVDAWAVCFLHSYANPVNERQAADLLRELVGDVPISTSSGVVGEYREYERFSTTVLNAFVAPLMDRYLGDVEAQLVADGYRHPLFVMQSNGGIVTSQGARRLPAATMLSGPAGGVAGALAVAVQAGIADVITCDMGGTSTDVSLIRGGQLRYTTEARIAGYPTRLPQLDIVTVGAGGGSIASVGAGGVLRVGPESAGANPGPACYGLGGQAATVTDANLVLNRLDASEPLSGEITLHQRRSLAAVDALAARLGGLSVFEMAEGVVRLAVLKMASAIREVSVYRGYTPGDFALVAFGGAGPTVASELASDLGMSQVVIPPYPGNLSALGLLVSPLRRDFVRTRVCRLAEAPVPELAAIFEELEAAAGRAFAEDGLSARDPAFHRSLDLRYVGQSFTISLPIADARADPDEVARGFHEAHERAFGHADAGEPVELVNLRLSAIQAVPPPPIQSEAPRGGAARPVGARPVHFRGRAVDCPVYRREELPVGAELAGPAIIQEPGSATIVWPLDRLRVDAHGNLRLEVAQK